MLETGNFIKRQLIVFLQFKENKSYVKSTDIVCGSLSDEICFKKISGPF